MKKKAFFLAFALFVLLTNASAQLAGDSYPPDTSQTTYYSLTMSGARTLGTGIYHVKGVYSTSPSGPFASTDTFYTGTLDTFSKVFDTLQANTTYYLGFMLYTLNYTDSFQTAVWSATTSQMPIEPTVTILSYVPALPKSMIIFSYTNAVGEQWKFFGQEAPTYTGSATDTATDIGNGIDTLYIPNGGNQSIPMGVIHFYPTNGTVPGIYPSNSTNFWPAFNAPPYTVPLVTSLDTFNVLRDSTGITMLVNPGNGGSVTTKVKVYTLHGTLVQSLNQVVITSGSDTALNYLFTAGTADSTYMIIGTAYNSTGTSYDTMYVTMQPSPVYGLPGVDLLAAMTVSQDSMVIAAYDTVGNSGDLTTNKVSVYDSATGSLVHAFANVHFWTDSALAYSLTTGLSPATTYLVIDTVTNVIGTSVRTLYVTTSQVDTPLVTIAAIPDSSTLTQYAVTVTVNPNGTYPGSKVDSLYFTDALGTVALPVSITTPTSVVVTMANRPSSTTYYPTVTIVNVAGLTVSASCVDSTLTPLPGFDPAFGIHIESNGPTSDDLMNISVVLPPIPGYVGKVLVGVSLDSTFSAYVDTVVGLDTVSVNGLYTITVSNLMPNTIYYFQLFGESPNGIIGGTGIVRWGETVQAQNPDVKDITISTVSQNTVSGQSVFNGEGTPAKGQTTLYESDVFVDSMPSMYGGIFQFTQNFFFGGLQPNQYFELRATDVDSATGATPIEMSKFFSTDADGIATIIDAQTYLDHVPMDAYNELGQKIASGLRPDLIHNYVYLGQITFIRPQSQSLFIRYGGQGYERPY